MGAHGRRKPRAKKKSDPKKRVEHIAESSYEREKKKNPPAKEKNQGWEGPGTNSLQGVSHEILERYCDLVARRINYKEAHYQIHEEYAHVLVGDLRYGYTTWRRFVVATDLGRQMVSEARARVQSEVKERSYADPYMRLDLLIEQAERMVEINRQVDRETTKAVDLVRYSKEMRDCFAAVREEVNALLSSEAQVEAFNQAVSDGDQEALQRLDRLKELSNIESYPEHVKEAIQGVMQSGPKGNQ